MSTTEKFLMLFSDFEMIVVEKTNEVKINSSNTHHSIGNNQTKSELKKVLKRLTEEYNRAKKSFKQNKLSSCVQNCAPNYLFKRSPLRNMQCLSCT